jgi:hypothetical protein
VDLKALSQKYALAKKAAKKARQLTSAAQYENYFNKWCVGQRLN